MNLSVIIPIYNSEQYLADCIDSVLQQSIQPDYELLLVDNGSSDNSPAICAHYVCLHSHVRLLHTETRGVSAARNYGLEQAAGDYILFMDSDDLWHRDLFKTILPLLENGTDMILFGRELLYTEDDRCDRPIPLQTLQEESATAYLERIHGEGRSLSPYVWNKVYRRNFLVANQLHFQLIDTAEDFQFNMECITAADRVAEYDAQLYYYRIRSGSLSRGRITANILMNCLEVKAYWYRQFPVPVLADLYAAQILLLGDTDTRENTAEVLCFIKDNEDILGAARYPRNRLARFLFGLFGYKKGARLYNGIRRTRQILLKGSYVKS